MTRVNGFAQMAGPVRTDHRQQSQGQEFGLAFLDCPGQIQGTRGIL